MSVADLAGTNGHKLTDAEARAAAREMWREADAAGEPITGVEIGRAFGKTDRWGRKQIAIARGKAGDNDPGDDTTAACNGTRIATRNGEDPPGGCRNAPITPPAR